MKVFCDMIKCINNVPDKETGNQICFQPTLKHIWILKDEVNRIKGDNKSFCGSYTKKKPNRAAGRG